MKTLYTATTLLLLSCFTLFAQTTTNESFMHGGINRTYLVHTPATVNNSPLIIVLHGLGDVGNGIMNWTRFNTIADTAGIVMAYPDGVDEFGIGAGWNNGTVPFFQTNDVGFLSQLIDTMAANHSIDLSRVYFAGFSMGGIMCHRLACDLSERIAGVASLSGTMAFETSGNCTPTLNVPVMHMHGTADSTVYYDGTFPPGTNISVDATISHWVNNHNCPVTPVVTSLPNKSSDGLTIETFYYGPCDGNSEVLFYKIINGTHTVLQPNNDVFAAKEVWDFFRTKSISLAPQSDFSASATILGIGQTITFTDESTNSPNAWSWTFAGGDPAVSSDQAPIVTYNTEGVYDVTLMASNSDGNNTATKTGYISVSPGTGIGSLKEGSPVNVQPNPFSDFVNFYTPAEFGAYQLKIYDAAGRLLESENVQASEAQYRLENDLGSGILFYTIEAENSTYHGKLIAR